MAMASPMITAEVIEVQEFPELAQKYQIRGVPMTVVNDRETLMGAVPAIHLVEALERVGGGAAD
jgi:predicted DsbA family dithiol-disulfide isomerase